MVEYRWAGGSIDRLPTLSAELVARPIDVIQATSGFAARAAKAATSTIPIVFSGVVDPVGQGLAKNVRQPGGNLTGIAGSFDALVEKRLQLLHEVAPAVARIGYLVNPENPNPGLRKEQVAAAGQALGVEVIMMAAGRPEELDSSLAAGAKAGIGAWLIADDAFFRTQWRQILGLAAGHAVPTIYPSGYFAINGGLISYSADFEDLAYQAGTYVGRILKGEKPAELPIMQPTKFELVINLKTAKALGLTVPPALLARADEVIE
jgi:putative ABC transport system substrate-binding protein